MWCSLFSMRYCFTIGVSMTPELLIAAEKRQRELGITSRSQYIQILMRKDMMEGNKDFIIAPNSDLDSDNALPSDYSLEAIKREINKLPPSAAKVLKRAETEIKKRKKLEAEAAEKAIKVIESSDVAADPEQQAMNELPQNDYGKQYQKTATKHYLRQAKITDPDLLEKFFAVDRAKLFPESKRFESLEEAIETAITDASRVL